MALEDTLAKIYKLPKGSANPAPRRISNREMEMFRDASPRLQDGSPLPSGMVPNMMQTMEFRDVNQDGKEDRGQGIYRQSDLVPESSQKEALQALSQETETTSDPEEREGLSEWAKSAKIHSEQVILIISLS